MRSLTLKHFSLNMEEQQKRSKKVWNVRILHLKLFTHKENRTSVLFVFLFYKENTQKPLGPRVHLHFIFLSLQYRSHINDDSTTCQHKPSLHQHQHAFLIGKYTFSLVTGSSCMLSMMKVQNI